MADWEAALRSFTEENIRLIKVHEGENNTIYLLEGESGKLALRESKQRADETQLQYESNLLDELAKQNLPIIIPTIFRTKDGKQFVQHKGKYYTLLNMLEGEKRFEWHSDDITDEERIHGYELFAKIHNACRNITLPTRGPRVTQLLDNYEQKISEIHTIPDEQSKAYLQKKKQFLLNKIKEIRQELEECKYTNEQVHPVPYDFHFGNVLWDGNHIIALLDFDWAQHSTLAWDFCRSSKMLCGTFSYNGNENDLVNEQLKKALETYNYYADEQLVNIPLLQTLMKVTSLFLLNWAIEHLLTTENPDYYIYFVETAIERLENIDYNKLFL